MILRGKKDIFHKGLVHGLCPKIELFLICLFFTEIISKIVVDILYRKE